MAAKVPNLIRAERRERSAFLRAVYREYDGARLTDLDAVADEYLTDHVLSRLSPAAVRRIREHRAAGHQTVLITGAIRPLTRPLIPLFDHIESGRAGRRRGRHLHRLPRRRRPWWGSRARPGCGSTPPDNGIDLAASYGYADSHSDLPLLEAVGRPVAVRPRRAALPACRASAWTIVDWASPETALSLPQPGRGRPMMLALEMFRSRAANRRRQGDGQPDARHPVRIRRSAPADDDRRSPRSTGPGWARLKTRLSGICGSDLGHAVGQDQPLLLGRGLAAVRARPRGRRRAPRRLRGPAGRHPGRRRPGADLRGPRASSRARPASAGATNRCSRITVGHLAPGLQTGFCKDTGGGWGQQLTAHRSQLHPVPEGFSDEQAILIEPLACAVHTALRAGVTTNDRVLVSGAGSVGLFATLALRQLTDAGEIIVVAKHGHQKELAREFGATEVVAPGEVLRRVRRSTGAFQLKPAVLLAVPARWRGRRRSTPSAASSRSRPRCTPPAPVVGSCSRGCRPRPTSRPPGSASSRSSAPTRRPRHEESFRIATELAATDAVQQLAKNVATYPLHRWREALDHAHSAGRLGTVKVAFDPRSTQ